MAAVQRILAGRSAELLQLDTSRAFPSAWKHILMSQLLRTRPRLRWRAPVAVLAASLLYNLGMGLLRPTLPLYLQQVFTANYQMVTLIPVVFGAGKWVTSLPTGYLLDRLGRRQLMAGGLLLIACSDIASVMTSAYEIFLGLRALAGMGWAMFVTAATTTMADRSAARRGRAVSLLLMSETLGLLLGSTGGGWLYGKVGVVSPFIVKAACTLVAVVAVGWPTTSSDEPPAARPLVWRDWHLLGEMLRTPGVQLMSLTNAVLFAIQTGVLVSLYPLLLAEQGGLGPETIGLLISLNALGQLLALWLGGTASDWWGRRRTLIPGLLAYGALLGSVTLVTHPLWLGL